MKIEDVIRVAFNKVAKRYNGTHLAQFDLNQPFHKTMITDEVIGSMVGRTLMLAMKRRPSRNVAINAGYLKRLKNLCREKKLTSFRSEDRMMVLFKNFHIYFYLQESILRVCVNTTNPYSGHNIQNILPTDLFLLLIGIDNMIEDLDSLVESFHKTSKAAAKSKEILLTSARLLISDISLPEKTSLKLDVDRSERILTIVTQNDYPYPPYHKSCRSTLETLREDVLKTIDKVRQYRFRGYVEEV